MRQAEGEHGIRLQAEKSGIRMVINRATGPVSEFGGVPDVVPMTVGEEEGVWFKFFLFQKVEEAFRGVDRQEVSAEVDEVGVGGGKATRVGQRLKHGISSFRLDEDED